MQNTTPKPERQQPTIPGQLSVHLSLSHHNKLLLLKKPSGVTATSFPRDEKEKKKKKHLNLASLDVFWLTSSSDRDSETVRINHAKPNSSR